MIPEVPRPSGVSAPQAQEQALLTALDPEQRQVVLHGDGPLLVLAGAGSGKTRAVTHRVAHLVACRDVPAWRICALTFTNRAARELLERVRDLAGPPGARVLCSTYHAFAARMLRRVAPVAGRTSDFVVYDERYQADLLKLAADRVKLPTGRRPLARVRSWLGRVKSSGLPPEQSEGLIDSELPFERLLEVVAEYESLLRQANAFDFGDLILRLAEAMEQHPGVQASVRGRFDHVLVDEYQDTSPAQERLLRGLVAPAGNLVVVGDDDQAIYAWRGATVDNILTFTQRWPGARKVVLERNYRSRPEVLTAANAVIDEATDRLGKVLRAVRPAGGEVRVRGFASAQAEARGAAEIAAAHLKRTGSLTGCAVFYRANWMSGNVETALRAAGLPHRVLAGLSFYQRQEVQDLLAHARFLSNPRDAVAAMRALRNPRRGIGPVTITKLSGRAASTDGDWMAALQAEVEAGSAAGRRVAGYLDATAALRERVHELPPAAALREAVQACGLAAWLETLESQERAEREAHLAELIEAARVFADEEPGATLPTFLEQTTLVTDTPATPEAEVPSSAGHVSLLTLHASKGLEFDTVIIVGVEEGVLPNARNDNDDEERRLCYVGFTRAKERLVLTWAASRGRWRGRDAPEGPSHYLDVLPPSVPRRDPPVWGGFGDNTWSPSRRRRRPVSAVRAQGLSNDTSIEVAQASPPEHYDQRPPATWEEPDAQPPSPGAMVRHGTFGEGEVVSVHGSGPTTKLGVRFPFRGVKRVLLGHLEIL